MAETLHLPGRGYACIECGQTNLTTPDHVCVDEPVTHHVWIFKLDFLDSTDWNTSCACGRFNVDTPTWELARIITLAHLRVPGDRVTFLPSTAIQEYPQTHAWRWRHDHPHFQHPANQAINRWENR